MKTFVVALFLLSGICFADSIDNFTYSGRSGLVYSFSLPASPLPYSTDPSADEFQLRNVPVYITQNGMTISGPTGDPTVPFSMQFFTAGTDYRFEMGCGVSGPNWDYCFIQNMASFSSPLFTGSLDHPTFILGDHGDGSLIISAESVPVPEGSELAMLGLAALVTFSGLRRRARRESSEPERAGLSMA